MWPNKHIGDNTCGCCSEMAFEQPLCKEESRWFLRAGYQHVAGQTLEVILATDIHHNAPPPRHPSPVHWSPAEPLSSGLPYLFIFNNSHNFPEDVLQERDWAEIRDTIELLDCRLVLDSFVRYYRCCMFIFAVSRNFCAETHAAALAFWRRGGAIGSLTIAMFVSLWQHLFIFCWGREYNAHWEFVYS